LNHFAFVSQILFFSLFTALFIFHVFHSRRRRGHQQSELQTQLQKIMLADGRGSYPDLSTPCDITFLVTAFFFCVTFGGAY